MRHGRTVSDNAPSVNCAAMSIFENLPTLECPCCGDDGAMADPSTGLFTDGEPLRCGCAGWVSVSADDDAVWINNGDDPCPPHAKCHDV